MMLKELNEAKEKIKIIAKRLNEYEKKMNQNNCYDTN
jgi:hypothetical protein